MACKWPLPRWLGNLSDCLPVCLPVRLSGCGSGDIAAVPPGYSALLGLL